MIPQRLRAPRLLLATSVLFFGGAYLTVRFPSVPGEWVGSFVSTFLIALPSFVALWRYLGPRRATLSLVSLSALGFAVEIIGVVSGFPYGSFYYGESLGPKVAALVPYLLPLSWVPLVLGSVAATAPLGKTGSRGRRLCWVLAAAALLTLVDGVLDPGATSLGFWVWPGGGFYYGVPVTNYLGWLFSSTLAAALLLSLGCWWESTPLPPSVLDSTLIALAFWLGVAVFFGLTLPAVLGMALYLFLLRRRLRLGAAVEGGSRYNGGGADDGWRLKA